MSKEVFVAIVTTLVLLALGLFLKWVYRDFGLQWLAAASGVIIILGLGLAFRLEALDRRRPPK